MRYYEIISNTDCTNRNYYPSDFSAGMASARRLWPTRWYCLWECNNLGASASFYPQIRAQVVFSPHHKIKQALRASDV